FAQDVVPKALSDKRSTTTSRPSSIQHVYFCRVEKIDKRIAPTASAVGVVIRRGVTDNEYRRQFRIDRRLLQVCLRRIVDLDLEDTNRAFMIRIIRGQLNFQIASCEGW